MDRKEEVTQVLSSLLKMDDVLACMLAKQGLGGIIPDGLKVKDANLWNLVKSTTNEIFPIINKFFVYKIDRINFELGQYIIIIAPVSQNFSLLVIIPSLANIGLVDIEIENSKRKIDEILKKPE